MTRRAGDNYSGARWAFSNKSTCRPDGPRGEGVSIMGGSNRPTEVHLDEPTSESFAGRPDGRTSFVAEKLAKELRAAAWKRHNTTDVRQQGYGPASFDVEVLDEQDQPTGLVATVVVTVKRVPR